MPKTYNSSEPSVRVLHDQNDVMQNPVFDKQPVKGVEYTGRR